jgi:multidrug efflux pump subunit AcrA (membrane-fusion protein)
MRFIVTMTLFASLTCLFAFSISAQETNNPTEPAEKLRTQLSEVQDREAEAKLRLQELDFALKPENIEHHFAGVGSVHPEELRELRRKQLQTEKDRLLAQLDQFSASRARLESAITLADAQAYQQSALGASALRPGQTRGERLWTTMGVILVGFVLVLVVGSLAVRLAMRR